MDPDVLARGPWLQALVSLMTSIAPTQRFELVSAHGGPGSVTLLGECGPHLVTLSVVDFAARGPKLLSLVAPATLLFP